MSKVADNKIFTSRAMPRKSIHGFALAELLVVILVIAFVFAIHMSAVQKLRAQAYSSACASRMRQYGMTVVLYANDNEGWFIPYCDKSAYSVFAPAHETVWFNRLAVYIGGKVISPSDTQAVKREKNGFNMNMDIRRCPSGKAWTGPVYGAQAAANIDAPFLTVQGESPVIGTDWGPGFKHSAIQTPAEWIIFIDTDTWGMYAPTNWGFNTDWSGDGIVDTYGGLSQPYNGAVPRVHSEGCNIVLADGHVERMSFGTFQDPLNHMWEGRPGIQ